MSSGGGDLHAALDLIPKLANWIAVVPEMRDLRVGLRYCVHGCRSRCGPVR